MEAMFWFSPRGWIVLVCGLCVVSSLCLRGVSTQSAADAGGGGSTPATAGGGDGTRSPGESTGSVGNDGTGGSDQGTATEREALFGGDEGGGTAQPDGGEKMTNGSSVDSSAFSGGSGGGYPNGNWPSGDQSTPSSNQVGTQASDTEDGKLQNSTLADPTQGQHNQEGSEGNNTATQGNIYNGNSYDGTTAGVSAGNDGDGNAGDGVTHQQDRGDRVVTGSGTSMLDGKKDPTTVRSQEDGITYPPGDQELDGTEETATHGGDQYPQDDHTLGGENPDTGSKSPGGETPDDTATRGGDQYPQDDHTLGGENPDTGSKSPGDETPDKTATRGGDQYPQDDHTLGGENPDTGSKSPGGETPDETATRGGDQYPQDDLGSENPDTGSKSPGGETPGEGNVTQESVGGDNPSTGSESPDGETPSKGDVTQDPGGGENPGTGFEKPVTGGETAGKDGVTATQEPADGEEVVTRRGGKPDGPFSGKTDAPVITDQNVEEELTTDGAGGDDGGTRRPGGEGPGRDGTTRGPGGQNPDTTRGGRPDGGEGTQRPDGGRQDGSTRGPGGENPDTTRGGRPDGGEGTQRPDGGRQDGSTRGPGGENPDTTRGGRLDGSEGTQGPDGGGPGQDGSTRGPGGEDPDTTHGRRPDRGEGTQGPDGGRQDGSTQRPGGENPDTTRGGRPDGGEGTQQPSDPIPKVVAVISRAPGEIPYCGRLNVLGGASVGPRLTYRWAVNSSNGITSDLRNHLKTINNKNSPDLMVDGPLLSVDVTYTVTLTVSSARGGEDTASHQVARLPETVMKPSLTIRHRRVGQDRVVLASKTIVLWADVQFFSGCIESSTVDFYWTATKENGEEIRDVLRPMGRNQRIMAHKLPVGELITIEVAIPPNGETVLQRTTASVSFTVQRSALVASIKGGTRITMGRNTTESLLLDASESYDPDDKMAELSYSWTCSSGEVSSCGALPSANDESILVSPGSLSVGSYDFAVTVRRSSSESEGQATARVTVEVDNGNPPLMKLMVPFKGKFRPTKRVVVRAVIRNAAMVASIDWQVLEDDVEKSVPEPTLTFVKKASSVGASFSLRSGVLTAGSEYTIKAIAKDSDGNRLSSADTTIMIYKGVTGCELQPISSYQVFEMLDISVLNCVGESQLTYKAFVAPSAESKDRQVLTTLASDQSILTPQAVEVPGASMVAIIVKICDETRSCEIVSQEGIQQVKEVSEEAIQSVKTARMEAVQKGDYVDALHKNGMLARFSAESSTGARRRRGAHDEALGMHRDFLRNATSDFPNLDVSQWDTVALELDYFMVDELEEKLDAVTNIQTMLDSYLELNPEEFDEEARDRILKKIGEVLMGLTPDTMESRDLIRRCRQMMRHLSTHVGRSLADGDSVSTPTGRSTVHLKRLTLQASMAIQAGTTQLIFPESLEHIGSSVTLNIEEYDDKEDLNSQTSQKHPLSAPIRSITMQKEDGTDYDISDLVDPIKITFPAQDGKHICLYYDDVDNVWSQKGVATRQAKAGDAVTCETKHLTDFATAEDVNGGGSPVPVGGLTVAAVAGIIVGVLALLVIVVLIVFMVLKMNKNKKVNPKD